MKTLDIFGWAALIALIIGGFQLGLMGLFAVSILTSVFGLLIGRLLFIIIGVAAGYLCYLLYKERIKPPVAS